MKQPAIGYVVSLHAEPLRHGTWYYWTICRARNPNEFVSSGYAPTLELAEAAARTEVNDLASGLSQGGLSSGVQSSPRRRCWLH